RGMELPMDVLGSLAKPLQQDIIGPTFRPVPDETATPMPAQDLEGWDTNRRVWPDHDGALARRRRALVFAATLALTAAASYEMYQVLNVSRMTVLQMALLVAFTVNFVWIALPCVNGLIGFVALWSGHGVRGITLPA